MRDYVPLGVFVLLVACAAVFGAQFQPGPWYAGLRKPPLNPPGWVFGPIWTLLYLAIAVAGWLVWRARPESLLPLSLWAGQLVLNGAWSYLFFGLRRPGAALVEILTLLVVLFITTASFFRVGRVPGALFLPYTAWVSFAAYLNAGIWFLNR
jgi:tryptophan-rich sensory protein